jgi:hypothetical protein
MFTCGVHLQSTIVVAFMDCLQDALSRSVGMIQSLPGGGNSVWTAQGSSQARSAAPALLDLGLRSAQLDK